MAQTIQSLPSIDLLNASSRNQFFSIISVLFEAAPPLANALWASRPYSSYATILSTAADIINNLSLEDRKAVVNAHPRIGANKATLSALSYQEQGYTNAPNSLTNEDRINQRLAELNAQYEAKFKFCFVVFVNGRSREEIIPVIEARLNNSAEEELSNGLEHMIQIAQDRLKKVQIS
ncbi:hypothetical protein QVD99_005587 [Batrachochytrium dendrobatidis]|nr:hypothetical protein QVD99_005587 [Batrachochytrium dendrobatidis]